MITLGERMLLITDKCTYAMQLADQIDPDRTNPALPHIFQQKLFDHGADSELLCHSFLQAWRLFRKGFQAIDIEHALNLSFDALSELLSMQETTQTFRAEEKSAIDRTQTAQREDGSLAVPAVGNVRMHCKTFAQKADHCAGALLAIVRLFYPDVKNWDELFDGLKKSHGEDDQFCKFMEAAVPFLQLVRNTRDCLDHRNAIGVTTRDFEPQADGQIGVPSIEVKFRKSKLERCPISAFMEATTKNLLTAFEMVIVNMCAKNVQRFAGMPMTVAPLSDWKAWRVRYAYGAYFPDGRFAVCG
jgi:hypothetical protein